MTPASIGASLLGLFVSKETARKFALLGFIASLLLAGIALFGAFQVWDYFDDKAAVKTDRDAANAEAATTARKADERAQRAGESTREGIEDENDRAREAAAGSDDPLGDALRSLRAKTHRDCEAADCAD